MWGKKTSPGGVHCHVQGEIVLKETCTCSFSALMEALLRFSIGKLDGLQRCFLFSLSEFSMWEFGLSCHRPFATRSCFWESPRDCQEMRLVPRIFSFGVVYCVFSLFSLCLMVVNLLQKFDLFQEPLWVSIIWYIFTDHCHLFPTCPVAQILLILGDGCLLPAIRSLETPNIP